MAVRGWATGCKWVNQGSELVAAAAVGDTVLEVDWVGDFDDDGGTFRLNDTDIDYTTVDEDADTIVLAASLGTAAAVGDRVDVVTSGQVLKDYTLFVTTGEGDDVEVDIPFAERDAWPEGEYDDPVEVVLSDDLERVESVPGVIPTRDAVFSYMPAAYVAKGADDAIPDSVWTVVPGWFAFQQDRVTYESATGKFLIQFDGMYDLRFGVTWAASGAGARSIRISTYNINGVQNPSSREVKVAASTTGGTAHETNQLRTLRAGEALTFDVYQNSGAALNLRGSNVITDKTMTEAYVRWVGPLPGAS